MNWDWDKLKEQQQKQKNTAKPVNDDFNNAADYEDDKGGSDTGGQGGPGGSGGSGSGWGGRPKPPNFGDMINKLQKSTGFSPKGRWGWIVAAIVVIIIGITSFYTIKQDEVGVIQRFGKYTRAVQPGLNFKLPFGIETVQKVNVKRVRTLEFGSETLSSNNTTSLMLTGDLNVAVVPWIVQFRIKDPYAYLFKVSNVDDVLGNLSEATMRLVVGDRSINEVISKRDEIAIAARNLLQEELERIESGIQIVTVEMKRTNVPEQVQPSFNEVNQATQEKEQMIYQAKEDYNKAIPAARGEAERTILGAQGYALDRVNRAEGDVRRFMDLYAEYILAKDVTKRRLYLESLQKFLPTLKEKFIIDGDQKNFLPFLNMKGGLK